MGKKHRPQIRKVVIKIGTNLLIGSDFKVRHENFERITKQIAKLVSENIKVIIVSSGAVGAGIDVLGLNSVPRYSPLKRLCAGIGQAEIIGQYRKCFSEHCLNISQILITKNEINERKKFLDIKDMLLVALGRKIVPVINENDIVTSDEDSFGNNDNLAMHIASKIDADLVIFLTNVDGVYTKDPKKDDSKLIDEIHHSEEIDVGKSKSSLGAGGIHEKIRSARKCGMMGIPVVIGNGNKEGIISNIIKGNTLGTKINADEKKNSKKRWIFNAEARGKLVIDEGAFIALNKKNSLLAAGIESAQGHFEKKSIVEIIYKGKKIAKAIVEFSSDDIGRIMGKKSKYIKKIEGFKEYRQVCARESIVFIDGVVG